MSKMAKKIRVSTLYKELLCTFAHENQIDYDHRQRQRTEGTA